MKRRQFTPEWIIGLLRQAEVELAQGKRVGEVRRGLGILEQSYYRWRTEYGDLMLTFVARAADPLALTQRLAASAITSLDETWSKVFVAAIATNQHF
jgi:hypothetical protein